MWSVVEITKVCSNFAAGVMAQTDEPVIYMTVQAVGEEARGDMIPQPSRAPGKKH